MLAWKPLVLSLERPLRMRGNDRICSLITVSLKGASNHL